jgi:nucleoside-diphosphate-sugar epimerase
VRVLVTEGAGLIGSHAVDALLARGDEVAAIHGSPQEQSR